MPGHKGKIDGIFTPLPFGVFLFFLLESVRYLEPLVHLSRVVKLGYLLMYGLIHS